MAVFKRDIFITHAWRYHDDWNDMVAFLDGIEDLSWRNFSLPWHDPALDPRTEMGGQAVRHSLDVQIRPVDVVICLASVYKVKSAQAWLDMQLEFAKQFSKPVLIAPDRLDGDVPDSLNCGDWPLMSWEADKDRGLLLAATQGAGQ